MIRVITINDEKIVVSVKEVNDEYVIGENELRSQIGELGQIMLHDGTFTTPTTKPELPFLEVSIVEQILSETQYQTALLEMQLLGGM